MSFLEAFLNVLAILGLIVAGGFLVFLLGNLLLSILEPRRAKLQEKDEYEESHTKVNEISKVQEVEDEQVATSEIEPSVVSNEKFILEEEEPGIVDFDAAESEKQSLGVPETKAEEKTDDINSIFNENDDFNFGDDDFDFDKLFAEENKPVEVEQTKQTETTDFVSDIVENNTPVTTAVSQTPEVKEVIKEVYIENHEIEDQLRSEMEVLKQELANQKALYEELKEQSKHNEQKWEEEKSELEKLYAQAEVHEEEKSVPLLTLEEYEARLEVLRERLKVNEKELKLNKKEFIPLKRVRKNLDKDKDKLRRREALVAKQKVMLYGVNNISEIDQDKAKKLAEDLDLLDGLKVSVRHCEEVMEENKDRYPILETANRILTTTHQELKDDIEECEKAIIEIKKANGDITDGAELTYVANENSVNEPPKRRRGRPKKITTENENSAVDNTVIEDNKQTIESLNTLIEKDTELFDNSSKFTNTEEFNNFDLSSEHEKLFEDFDEQPIKKEEHKFNFDAEEPSFEDLFAIENEENSNNNK